MATIVRYLTFVIVVTGCTFASPTADLPDVIPPAPVPVAQPCRTDEQGVVLCVDFEDKPLVNMAADRSPSQLHATAVNVGSVQRLTDEQAALLRETSSLRVPESPRLDVTTFTIEMWIRPEQAPVGGEDAGKLDSGLFDNPGHYTMRIRNDLKIRCGLDEVTRVSSESAVPPQTWSHVACRYSQNEMRVYINGQLSDCQDLGSSIPPAPVNAGSAIGSELVPVVGVKDRFIGGVDNVRIYDRALEEADICRAAGQTGTCWNECPGGGQGDGHGGDGRSSGD